MFNRINIILIVFLLIVTQAAVFAQAPDTLWTKTFGYPGRLDDTEGAIIMPDGGLAMVGTSTEQGYLSWLYVVRTNSDGDTLWTRTFDDGTTGQAICPTPENGFLTVGVIAESTFYPYMVNIDSAGNELWSRTYWEWPISGFRSIQPVDDVGYLIAGYIPSSTYSDIFLVRIDLNGDTLWTRTYGGAQAERAWSVKPTSDGGFVVVGWTESFGNGGSDFYILKTDQNGDTLWTRTYGDSRNEEARDILETPDGGFVFSGRTAIPESVYQYYAMKIDSQGDSVWAYADTAIMAPGMFQTFTSASEGGFTLLGYTWNSIDVYRISESGAYLWSRKFVGDQIIAGYSRSIIQSEDGSYFLCGYNNNDIWVVKLAAEQVGIDDNPDLLPNKFTLHQNYPNPFNANTRISFALSEPGNVTLSIYDLLGRKLSVLTNGQYEVGEHALLFEADDLTSGIYFYNLKVGELSETKSMILLK